MAIPDFQTIMLPLLRLSSEGEIRISDAVGRLADQMNLTEEERTELLPSGRQATFANRVHWAKLYLTKSGLLEATRRAHFKITVRGRQTLSENPSKIDRHYLSRFEEYRKFRERSAPKPSDAGDGADDTDDSTNGDTRTPDEIMRGAYKTIERTLRQELLERIIAAPPEFFEQLVVNLLIAMGYGGSLEDAGRTLGRSGDGGVDGVIDQDALGLDRVYIQAKRYQEGNVVGAGQIRDFFGSLDRFKAAKGLFVTTSTFTKDARDTAGFLSKRIALIDGDQLTALMVRFNVGCRVEETLHLKKMDEDFFPN